MRCWRRCPVNIPRVTQGNHIDAIAMLRYVSCWSVGLYAVQFTKRRQTHRKIRGLSA
jgi:hypothetical protein